MGQCVVDRRANAHAAAERLDALACVARPTEVLSPAEGSLDRWVLDVLVESDGLRVPADVLDAVQAAGFGVRRSAPYGPDYHHLRAVAQR